MRIRLHRGPRSTQPNNDRCLCALWTAPIATNCTEADVSIRLAGLARDLGVETVSRLMMDRRTTAAMLARQAL
jgi:hypothetical protein